MIRVEHIETWGFEHAIRGLRNPMNSWAKSDSGKCLAPSLDKNTACGCGYCIGPDDLNLMRRLFIGGPEHRKYLRQIFVSMDIIAPDYWFKEFATYRIGVTENSTSTMHKIHAKPFEVSDFSTDHMTEAAKNFTESVMIPFLEQTRRRYMNEGKKKEDWYDIIELLPMSYNYRRTVTMNYENVVNMIHQREFHKLAEWNEFVEVLKGLPYIEEIMQCEK